MAIAIALLGFTSIVPAAACCVSKPIQRMASMRALMPCCAGACKLTKTSYRPDREYSLTSVPTRAASLSFTDKDAAPVVMTSTNTPLPTEASGTPFAVPPSFLSHRQFRI